mmetsp:Transcript_47832/g.103080  ORF Transcript_47832/g.103080 Transcript_47832/m.103080 type:complete len:363 (+) Transcript_47832:1533-2621(+)
MVLFVNSCLATQTNLFVFLLCKLPLVHLFQFFDLAVGILLELGERLLVGLESELLLADEPVLLFAVCTLNLFEVLPQLLNLRRLRLEDLVVLRLPLLSLLLQVLRKLLISVNLDEHLLLKALLQVLSGLRMVLFLGLDVLPQGHLHLGLLFAKYFELAPFSFDFLAVLLLHFCHFLLVVAISMPKSEVDAARQLFDLPLQVELGGLLVVEEGFGHENLVGEPQESILIAFRRDLLFDFEDDQAAIITGTEEILFVVGDPDSRDRQAVRLIFDIVPVEGEAVASNRARQLGLGNAGEEGLGLSGKSQLSHGRVGLQTINGIASLHLLQRLVRAHHIDRVRLLGILGGSVGNNAREVCALLCKV